jgi:hypothetical protein
MRLGANQSIRRTPEKRTFMTKSRLARFSCIVILSIGSSTVSHAQSAAIGNNIYSPILVTSKGFIASGVYWTRGTDIYFLTAKHVLLTDSGGITDSTLTLMSHVLAKGGFQKCVLEIKLDKALKSGELRAHKTHDIATVRIGFDTIVAGIPRIQLLDYVIVKVYPDSGISPSSAITLFESAIISNDAFVLGYPAAIGVPEMPQLDYSQPLIRRGIVAGKNFGRRTLIVDCPTYPGNSGGPVLEVDDTGLARTMRLIGVVSQFIPFQEIWQNRPFGYENRQLSNSGYTVVEPMDFAIELTR